MLYYIDRFPVLKEQCDTVTAVAALVAQEWANLNESAKAEYRRQAEATQNARKSLCFFEKEEADAKPRKVATHKKSDIEPSKGVAAMEKAEMEPIEETPAKRVGTESSDEPMVDDDVQAATASSEHSLSPEAPEVGQPDPTTERVTEPPAEIP